MSDEKHKKSEGEDTVQLTSTPALPEWSDAPRRLPDARLPTVTPGTYDVQEEVARGGLGRVVKAQDRRLGRTVAIKELLPGSQNAEARFVREAMITARLEHPSIVPVHEAGRWPSGQAFYAMKLVSGRSLAQIIEERPSFSDRLALVPKVLAVAEAVAYAHSRSVIHRDLKPSNVIIGHFGETVVIDWGLAKDLSAEETEDAVTPDRQDATAAKTVHGEILGTPNYMPPEQAMGMRADQRSDVYSLGALLYHTLAGVPPYASRAETPGSPAPRAAVVLKEVINRPPLALEERQPQVPEDLLIIVNKAMARDPKQRYPSAQELADDLRRFEAGQLISARRYSPWALIERGVKKHWPIFAVVGVACLLLLGGGVWSLRRIIVAKGAAETERSYAETQRALAQEARAQAEQRQHELILLAAKSALDRDPTSALAWLKQYPRGAADWAGVRSIATDAWDRGVARDVWRAHHGGVWKVAFSPDGKRLASASADRSVGLWDLATGTSTMLVGHEGEVNAVAFSGDGRMLASASDDGTIWIWALEPQPQRLLVLRGHQGTVSDVAFYPDSSHLASAGYDRTIREWDTTTGANTVLGTHDARAWVVAVSPDGATVASGGDDHLVRLWDTRTRKGRALARQPRHITGLAFLDAQRVVSLAADGTALLWNVARGEQRRVASSPYGEYMVAAAPGGKVVATAGSDRVVRLWDLDAGGVTSLLGHSGTVMALAFSPDGKQLATAGFDNTVRVWPLREPEEAALRGHEREVFDVSFLADGTPVSTGADGTVRVWDARHHGEIACEGRNPWRALAVVPGRRRVVTASSSGPVELCDLDRRHSRPLGDGFARRATLVVSRDGRRVLWSAAEKGLRIRDLDADAAEDVVGVVGEALALSPDGETVAFGNRDEVMTCQTARCLPTLRTIDQHDSWVRAVAFSPDGRLLASAGGDRAVRVRDIGDGALRVYPGHNALVVDLEFSPDGRLLASASDDTTIRLLDVKTGVARVLSGHDLSIAHLQFSRDGTMLASVSGSEHAARIWEVATGQSRVLRGHAGRVHQATFSPDGKVVATASDDGTVRLWPASARGIVPDGADAVARWLDQVTRARIGPKDIVVSP